MFKIDVDFSGREITLETDGQNGTEFFPEAADKRAGALAALELPDMDLERLVVDFESGDVLLKLPPDYIAARKDAFLSAMGYEKADMRNVVGLVNAFINGAISEELFNQAMLIEGGQNEKNPFISELLNAVDPQEED